MSKNSKVRSFLIRDRIQNGFCASRRSLFFRRRIASFDGKVDDEQQEITNVLAHLSAIEISDDLEQVDVSIFSALILLTLFFLLSSYLLLLTLFLPTSKPQIPVHAFKIYAYSRHNES